MNKAFALLAVVAVAALASPIANAQKVGNLNAAIFSTRCDGVKFSSDGSERFYLDSADFTARLPSGAELEASCSQRTTFNNGADGNFWQLRFTHSVPAADIQRLNISRVRLFRLALGLNSGQPLPSSTLQSIGGTVACRANKECGVESLVQADPVVSAGYHVDQRVSQLVLRAYRADGAFYEHRININSATKIR